MEIKNTTHHPFFIICTQFDSCNIKMLTQFSHEHQRIGYAVESKNKFLSLS